MPKSEHVPDEDIIACLSSGFSAAELSSDSTHYKTLKDKEIVYVHPSSILFEQRRRPKCVIFSEIVITTKKYMRGLSEADLKICIKQLK
jgi:HrpA-like RNA helicase